jgi:hypothetical protein
MNTTLSPGSGAGTVSPAGSRQATPSGTLLVVVIHDMSAGVTSDPSQLTERAWSWAELSSPDVDVAVILDDAILLAGTRRESRSPVVLILSISEIRGILVSPAYHSHRG